MARCDWMARDRRGVYARVSVCLYAPPSSSAANKPLRCSSAVAREQEATWLTLRKINVAAGKESGGEEPAAATRDRLPARVDAWMPPCEGVRLRCRGANDVQAEAGQRAKTVPSLSNHTAAKLGREIFP